MSENYSDDTADRYVGKIGKRLILLNGRAELYVGNETPRRIKPEHLPGTEMIVKYAFSPHPRDAHVEIKS